MKPITKFTLLTMTLLSSFSNINKNITKTKAEDNLTRVMIDYDAGKDSTDSAYVMNQINNTITGQSKNVRSVLFGFDTKEEISSIVRMHFRITYRQETFFDALRNKYLESQGKPKEHGTVTEITKVIKNDLDYSFKTDKYQLATGSWLNRSGQYENESKLVYPAIGLVSRLLEAEEYARRISGGSLTNDYIKMILTGGYKFKVTPKDRLNDSSKTFATRKYYAVIPLDFVEDLAPESIAAYDVYGNYISDGLDENGDPMQDADGRYIEATVTKDFGVAINGQSAKLNKISVSGIPANSNAIIMLQNAGYDKEKSEIINITNTLLLNENTSKNLNWSISENNRYVFIKWENPGDIDLSEIKIKFYYSNTSNEVAFLINVTGKDDNFLPPPIITPRPDAIPGITLNDLILIVLIVGGLLLALIFIIDVLKQTIVRTITR